MTTISAEVVANNIDLLTGILLRLPAKPRFRFKCISKQWLSLISHISYPTPTALFLKKYSSPTPISETVPLKQNTNPQFQFLNDLDAPCIYIEQSCNGLFLCLYKSRSFHQQKLEYIYYICNPTTMQYKKLPSPPALTFNKYMTRPYIAFEPWKSNHYKVICFSKVEKLDWYKQKKNTDWYLIDMYSSETDCWRSLDISFTSPNRVESFSEVLSAVFCNGSLHWYSKGNTSIYFDVDRECFNTMPMPNSAQRGYYQEVRYFGESRGCLHLIVTDCPQPLQFDVLEMFPDYSRWFVRCHVNIDAVRIAFPDIVWYREGWYRFSVLYVIRGQEEEDSIIVVLVDNKAISYSVRDGTSKKLCDLEPNSLDYTCRDTFPYFHSLTAV